MNRFIGVSLAVLGAGCGPTIGLGGEDEGTGGHAGSSSGAGSGSPSTTSGPETTSTSGNTADPSTSSSTGDEVSSGVDFIFIPDGGLDGYPCSVFQQDCALGSKCVPFSNDGSGTWNDLRCVPVAPDAVQPGDACIVEGSFTSGIDDCDAKSMCWDVDPSTSTGTCVAFCTGSPDDPSCDDPGNSCVMNEDGLPAVCEPCCNPLAGDCGGSACLPIEGGFVCSPDAGGQVGLGEPCEFVGQCAAGLFCAAGELVPDCDALGCCAALCDTQAADPCPDAPPEVSCVPWFEDPPKASCVPASLGICLLPS